ncbi:hypothetical protein ARMGADRAFT_1160522 [Armillaria gallica]|uniref:Uncharacterized protein n=1 Tax=Armillaria gallica TaxID=47427 RepID=A0A2H3EN41_ARMGA|nr:hypothetical protein ARMGADRAFT_1160522 [Armillaria gallica]
MNHELIARFQGLSTRTDLEPYGLILQASGFRLQVSDYIVEVHGSILSEFLQAALRLMLPNYQRCMSASVVTCWLNENQDQEPRQEAGGSPSLERRRFLRLWKELVETCSKHPNGEVDDIKHTNRSRAAQVATYNALDAKAVDFFERTLPPTVEH